MHDPKIHAVLGAIVVTIGLWLVWGELPVALVAAIALAAAGFLIWQGTTIAHMWAWTCVLLGFASAAWPMATMVQVRMAAGEAAAAEPSDEQMGLILTAVVAGLFSSVFWVSFGIGIFRWIKRKELEQAEVQAKTEVADGNRSRKQSQNRR
ncbi:MAG: hypothetical protein EXR97_05490 [Nitrospiraceae bacterium]|nr:hypothetical protein [Nitrospiraceae bacterium]MSR25098.1 hypothetical protein [Nitrospiraceae bacterium]